MIITRYDSQQIKLEKQVVDLYYMLVQMADEFYPVLAPKGNIRIYPALQKMFDAARADSVYPVVVSGYRTVKKQQSLMDEKIAAYKAEGYTTSQAKAEAETWCNEPWHFRYVGIKAAATMHDQPLPGGIFERKKLKRRLSD